MKKFPQIIIAIILALITLQSTAQNNADLRRANRRLNNSQDDFTQMLRRKSMETDDKAVLNRFISETDSLQKIIRNNKNLTLQQKIMALDCQRCLYDTLRSEMTGKKIDGDFIRESRENFIPLWQMIADQKSYDEILQQFGPKAAGVMAVAFKEYPQGERIKEIATLKKLQRNPENIIQFLANNVNYSLKDSLIFIYGNKLPEKLISFVQESKNEELVKAVRQNNNPLIQTLLSIANEKNLKNYLPFVVQLTENKTTLADIDNLRAEPSKFFRAIVDAELANKANDVAGKKVLYKAPTRQYLKEYGKMFYTDVINSQHNESNEKVRYSVLEGLRPQDLYFIITNNESELYTSSYLYTYKKLMGMFEKGNYNALFDLVNYDQYRKFLLMAGRYNTLAPFLQQMPQQTSASIIKKLMQGLEINEEKGLEDIVNVAEMFPAIIEDKYLSELAYQEIKDNYNRSTKTSNREGIKVYSMLTDIYKAVKSEEAGNFTGLPAAFAPYFKISHTALRGKDGSINQLVMFFGDEDGKSSYASFLSGFSDASQWTIEKNKTWVKITSKKKYPVSIYANMPLGNEDGQDLKAQEELMVYLKEQQVEPRILILRGHSYHMANSFKYFTPSIKLGIIGSCGGYTEITEILEKSSNAQVISTKQIGSMQINDPMLKLINNKLLNQEDLEWTELWGQLEKQFKPNKQLYDYFKEYVPPYKNIALLVTSLYNSTEMQYQTYRN